MVKRCSFCGHKLDDDGLCTNEKCPEYTRAQIVKAAKVDTTAQNSEK